MDCVLDDSGFLIVVRFGKSTGLILMGAEPVNASGVAPDLHGYFFNLKALLEWFLEGACRYQVAQFFKRSVLREYLAGLALQPLFERNPVPVMFDEIIFCGISDAYVNEEMFLIGL